MAEQPETLAYAANDPEVIVPWRRGVRFRWVPAVAIAMFLLALLQAGFLLQYRGLLPRVVVLCTERLYGDFFFPILACFAALLIKRRGAKRLAWSAGVLGVLVGAAAFPGPEYFSDTRWWNPAWDEFQAVWFAGAFVAVCACWHPRFPKDWKTLTPKMIFAAVCIWQVMLFLRDGDDLLWFEKWKWMPPGLGVVVNVSFVLSEFAYVLLVWGAITFLCRMPGRPRSNAVGKGVWAMILAAAVVAGAYLRWGREAMAEHWLAGHGSEYPASQLAWDYFLSHRPSRPSLLALIEGYPWPTVTPTGDKYLGLSKLPIAKALQLLPDDGAAVRELARKVNAEPNGTLWELIAGRVMRHRCYEAAPALLHVALFKGGKAARKALLEMGIPQAAWVLLYQQNSYWSGLELPTQGDAEMAKLLGVTAKRTEDSWLEVLAAKGGGRHAPIPDAISDACDREVATFRKYVAAVEKVQAFLRDHPEKIGNVQASDTWKSAIFCAHVRSDIAKAAGLIDPESFWPTNPTVATPSAEPAAIDRFARDVDAFLVAQAAGGVKAGGGSSRP